MKGPSKGIKDIKKSTKQLSDVARSWYFRGEKNEKLFENIIKRYSL